MDYEDIRIAAEICADHDKDAMTVSARALLLALDAKDAELEAVRAERDRFREERDRAQAKGLEYGLRLRDQHDTWSQTNKLLNAERERAGRMEAAARRVLTAIHGDPGAMETFDAVRALESALAPEKP